MATDKKRLSVYLDVSDKEQLDQIAEELGSSVSKLCGDILINSLPQLRVMADAMQMARTNPQKAAQMMRDSASTAQAQLQTELEGLK